MSEWQRGTIGELAKGYRGVTYSAGQLREFKAHDTVTLLRSNNISGGQLNFGDVQIVSERLVSDDQLLTPGDIAVCMSNGSKALVGKSAQLVAASDERFTVGAFCSVFRPQQSASSRFVAYVFQSSSYRSNLDLALAGTAINNLRNVDVEAFACGIPPYSEQSRIAQILDTLDSAIHETEALIDKLKAVKQGLLHDLLTRGIDANGQLRPPQSEAPQLYKESPLGWIPREWEVDCGKNVCREIVVGIVIKPTQYYRESGVAVLRSANVRETGLTLDNLVFMSPKDHRNLSKSAVGKGDVLTVRTGYPGTSCVVDDQIEEANCVDIIISRPLPDLDPSYWSTWINSDFGKKQVLAVQGGLAQQHFNVGDLMKLMVKMPPITEQEAISDRLRGVLSRIDLESKEQSKLFALKAALMDDLLTGRVRVTPLLESAQQPAAQTGA